VGKKSVLTLIWAMRSPMRPVQASCAGDYRL
jgi:hypothetical protein